MSYTPSDTKSQEARRLLPAEWAPQSGVMFTWPRPDCAWGPHQLAAVERTLATAAAAISRRQLVLISCEDEAHCAHVRTLIESAGGQSERIRCRIVPSNDVWVRDHGPITVFENGAPLLLDFVFNGWGGKYPAEHDNRLTRTLHAAGAFGQTPLASIDLVLEGGSLESDGEGTLLTTSNCLLHPGRNPGLSREQIEERLRATLGVERVLWLEHGWLAGDDTDGHIDMLARFCTPDTIAYTACNDPADEHYAELAAMKEELEALRDRNGRPYRLLPLPLPEARYDDEGQRLPASYANFLIINGAVLVPVYDDPAADAAALETLRGAFPGHAVEAIPALPLIHQYGSLHCATMQLPLGVLA
jgi:agmatine deiminase